jgi:hypothetical protein
MAKESVIVITEDELEPEEEPIITIKLEDVDEKSPIRVGLEDLTDDAAIIITEQDIAEGDMRTRFQSPLGRQFIAFVSAGLPDVFLKSQSELLNTRKQKQIKEAIDQVPDQALKKHLISRLGAIERF